MDLQAGRVREQHTVVILADCWPCLCIFLLPGFLPDVFLLTQAWGFVPTGNIQPAWRRHRPLCDLVHAWFHETPLNLAHPGPPGTSEIPLLLGSPSEMNALVAWSLPSLQHSGSSSDMAWCLRSVWLGWPASLSLGPAFCSGLQGWFPEVVTISCWGLIGPKLKIILPPLSWALCYWGLSTQQSLELPHPID